MLKWNISINQPGLIPQTMEARLSKSQLLLQTCEADAVIDHKRMLTLSAMLAWYGPPVLLPSTKFGSLTSNLTFRTLPLTSRGALASAVAETEKAPSFEVNPLDPVNCSTSKRKYAIVIKRWFGAYLQSVCHMSFEEWMRTRLLSALACSLLLLPPARQHRLKQPRPVSCGLNRKLPCYVCHSSLCSIASASHDLQS